MSSTNLASNYQRGCVSGLFSDDAKAERAVDDLKAAGFSGQHISVATVGGAEAQTHAGLWSKVNDLFGKEDRSEPSTQLRDSLVSCGMDEATASYFDDSLEAGKVLITVVGDATRVANAREIMQRAGADLGMGGVASVHREGRPVRADRGIELRGEVLRATKERVPAGEVRLRKEVVSEKRHVEVPVQKEDVVIERTPASGQRASGPVGDKQEIRVPVSEERVHVEKEPVVNEEVRVHKEPVHETKRVEGEVRHEELRSEQEGKARVRSEKDEKDRAA